MARTKQTASRPSKPPMKTPPKTSPKVPAPMPKPREELVAGTKVRIRV